MQQGHTHAIRSHSNSRAIWTGCFTLSPPTPCQDAVSLPMPGALSCVSVFSASMSRPPVHNCLLISAWLNARHHGRVEEDDPRCHAGQPQLETQPGRCDWGCGVTLTQQGVAGHAGGWTEMGALRCPDGSACASLPPNRAPKRQFRVSSKGINPQGREERGGKSSDTILGAGRWRMLGTDGEIWEGGSSAHGGGVESDWHHRTEPPAGFWELWTTWE